jgi:hypothetical protein
MKKKHLRIYYRYCGKEGDVLPLFSYRYRLLFHPLCKCEFGAYTGTEVPVGNLLLLFYYHCEDSQR